jgi:hypothetical protein
MSVLGCVSITMVASWLVLTAFAQYRPISARLSRYDPFRLIPSWTFFAPNPSVVDYHIVVRDERIDGSLGPWRALEIGAERHFLNCIWNPQKRPKKILIDAVQSLVTICQMPSYSEGHEMLSLPYLLLLHLAETVPGVCEGSVRRQFAIVHSTGHVDKTIQLSYLSQFHKISSD